ncbi:hypothetical protein MW651_004428 [Vibrio vulnificus]|nr:hypothetical protein [Vibrio vulnificus]
MSFGGESGVRKVGLCGTHPLTQRYVKILTKSSCCTIKLKLFFSRLIYDTFSNTIYIRNAFWSIHCSNFSTRLGHWWTVICSKFCTILGINFDIYTKVIY